MIPKGHHLTTLQLLGVLWRSKRADRPWLTLAQIAVLLPDGKKLRQNRTLGSRLQYFAECQLVRTRPSQVRTGTTGRPGFEYQLSAKGERELLSSLKVIMGDQYFRSFTKLVGA